MWIPFLKKLLILNVKCRKLFLVNGRGQGPTLCDFFITKSMDNLCICDLTKLFWIYWILKHKDGYIIVTHKLNFRIYAFLMQFQSWNWIQLRNTSEIYFKNKRISWCSCQCIQLENLRSPAWTSIKAIYLLSLFFYCQAAMMAHNSNTGS